MVWCSLVTALRLRRKRLGLEDAGGLALQPSQMAGPLLCKVRG